MTFHRCCLACGRPFQVTDDPSRAAVGWQWIPVRRINGNAFRTSEVVCSEAVRPECRAAVDAWIADRSAQGWAGFEA